MTQPFPTALCNVASKIEPGGIVLTKPEQIDAGSVLDNEVTNVNAPTIKTTP